MMANKIIRNVLLLNPPGRKRYLRDYYCSHISKGRYYWHPYDLVVLSGIVSEKFKVKVVDAIAVNWDEKKTINYILNNDFQAIIFLSGAVSWKEDFAFMEYLKKKGDFLIIGSGDIFLEQPERLLSDYPFLDAIILDFTQREVLDFLDNKNDRAFSSIVFKTGSLVTGLKEGSGENHNEFEIPVPRHELFPLSCYTLPHLKNLPFVSVITAFGCPYNCCFCPFERINFKKRKLENIYEELIYIKGLGIKELWIKDQTFGADRAHSYALCDWMVKEKLNFNWSCETRVDTVDEEFLSIMKKAGCHTVMFGVESANEGVLARYKKIISKEQTEKAFYLSNKIGLKTLAHFILGLPGENGESQRELIDFAIRLNPDYASFNIIAPQPNTTFKEESLVKGWIPDYSFQVDSSCSFPVVNTELLTAEDTWKFRKMAIKKFYLRPGYIIKRIFGLLSWKQAILQIKEISSVIRWN